MSPVVPGKRKVRRRSGCPVSIGLEQIGDRWSLLIIRDLMVRGYHTFKQFQNSGEDIATNVLANRLRRLQSSGIILAEPDEADARRLNYRLTEKGIDLAPVVLEMLLWSTKHEQTGAPCDLMARMAQNRQQVISEVRRRWEQRDLTPFLPSFDQQRTGDATSSGSAKYPRGRR